MRHVCLSTFMRISDDRVIRESLTLVDAEIFRVFFEVIPGAVQAKLRSELISFFGVLGFGELLTQVFEIFDVIKELLRILGLKNLLDLFVELLGFFFTLLGSFFDILRRKLPVCLDFSLQFLGIFCIFSLRFRQLLFGSHIHCDRVQISIFCLIFSLCGFLFDLIADVLQVHFMPRSFFAKS